MERWPHEIHRRHHRARCRLWLQASCAVAAIVAGGGLAWGQLPPSNPALRTDQPGDPTLPADQFGGALPRTEGAELLLFQEIPVVVSASRQAQPMNMLSVPVSVVSAEDIHYSGLTTIPEILQFVPGMDVLKTDRNNYAIGVRGLHHTFADRTLTLINGRNAASPAFGGADFLTLPIFMEDIERIEVVRGPGGAAWGANAFNGVINIITKKPEDVRGFLASSTVDHFGDSYNYLRWADGAGNWAWRISMGYEDRKSSQEALGDNLHFQSIDERLNGLIGFDAISSNDWLRAYRLDTEATYHFSDETRLSFGVAAGHVLRGDLELLGLLTTDPAQSDPVRAFARLDFKPGHETSGYIQWFGNYEYLDRPVLTTVQTLENDLESQITFAPTREQKLTLGGNVRASQIESEGDRSTDMFGARHFTEECAGVFAIDRWQVTDRLALEAQGRVDWYSETGVDWSGRLSSLYALDSQKWHILRLSAAKAFRTPLMALRELDGRRVFLPPPAPPGTGMVSVLGNERLNNEEVHSLEAGYNAQFSNNVSLRLDGYYQRYERLIGASLLADPSGMGRQLNTLDNLGGADGLGVETELAYTSKSVKASLWYALNYINLDDDTASTRSFLPAKHKAGAALRWFIGDGWTINSNYRFSDITPNDTLGIGGALDAASYHRVDLSITKSLFQNKAEVMLGVEDLLDDTGSAIMQSGSFTSHDTPGRTVFVRLQARF